MKKEYCKIIASLVKKETEEKRSKKENYRQIVKKIENRKKQETINEGGLKKKIKAEL